LVAGPQTPAGVKKALLEAFLLLPDVNKALLAGNTELLVAFLRWWGVKMALLVASQK
jgi:hypothetical protein